MVDKSLFRLLVCLSVTSWAFPAPTWGRDVSTQKLTEQLAGLEAVVAPASEQKALAGMLADVIRARRQVRNDESTAAWKSIANREDWEQFGKPKLEALRASLGEFPAPPRPLEVRVTGGVAGEGFRIDNLVFQSRPGLWVTANLYRPAEPRPAMPGILICHAHHTPKDHGELQDMGMTWARAGCLVLVMDQLGHGERRQHPFVDATSYPKPYLVSRQDYFFRYDNGIQLHLVGDSLVGWMVWDMMRGVDLLLNQKGIDPKRIILLGAVAGGGDPSAVAGAVDERIACVVPFNFGGPQPETRYPLPDDVEKTFNYAGGGSWESTRNLRRSAADGFLPWVIVGGIGPRRLVFAHEFSWDRPRDPVWKRLQAIYAFNAVPDHLAYTHGRGQLKGKPPEATHCTHIGAEHRKMIHEALRRWFAIDVIPEKEYSNRLPAEKLRCWTPEAIRDLQPRRLTDLLQELASERTAKARQRRAGMSSVEQQRLLQQEWKHLLGNIEAAKKIESRSLGTERLQSASVERILLRDDSGIVIPLLLLLPEKTGTKKPAVVIAFCQAGKAAVLRQHASEVAALLEAGVAVCLPDVRGTGETAVGTARGRTSAATSLSSSQLMLGETQVGGQVRDLRTVLAWLRSRGDVDAARLRLWGDSLARVNPPDANYVAPRDDDANLPPQAEPMGGLLALLVALYENDVQAIYVRGGLLSFRSILERHIVSIPHDVVVPGLLTIGDLTDVAAALAPRSLCLDGIVDGGNRLVDEAQVRQAYQSALDAYQKSSARTAFQIRRVAASSSQWLLARE